MEKNISLERAQELLLKMANPGVQEFVPLMAALGRVLGEDLLAEENIPPFKRSPLDGYALQALDILEARPNAPVRLQVLEEVAAGHLPQEKITRGTAIKVMTGTPIPEGADVVVRFEDVFRAGSTVSVFSALKSGSNIVFAGEDVAVGEIVAHRGDKVTPAHIGMAAALGIMELPVFRRPKVLIISTGDELIPADQELLPATIRNSNFYTLQAACHSLEIDAHSAGIIPDQRQCVADAFLRAAAQADLVLSTGGVSVGDHDVVEDALRDCGARIVFSRVAMKPGTPTLAAEINGTPAISLSGNPAAALIAFDLLVVPVLKKMSGCTSFHLTKLSAVVTGEFPKGGEQRRFLRGRLHWHCGNAQFLPVGSQNPGVLRSMSGCNALADIPAGNGPLVPGNPVEVVYLGAV